MLKSYLFKRLNNRKG